MLLKIIMLSAPSLSGETKNGYCFLKSDKASYGRTKGQADVPTNGKRHRNPEHSTHVKRDGC